MIGYKRLRVKIIKIFYERKSQSWNKIFYFDWSKIRPPPTRYRNHYNEKKLPLLKSSKNVLLFVISRQKLSPTINENTRRNTLFTAPCIYTYKVVIFGMGTDGMWTNCICMHRTIRSIHMHFSGHKLAPRTLPKIAKITKPTRCKNILHTGCV